MRKRKRTRDYENINDPKQEQRMPGERIILEGHAMTNWIVFRKSAEEKLRLKIAKARYKLSSSIIEG